MTRGLGGQVTRTAHSAGLQILTDTWQQHVCLERTEREVHSDLSFLR